MLKVNEMFYSLQGEGKYAGHPSFFIRLSKCTRKCDFCDTDFNDMKVYQIDDIVNLINHFSNLKDIHIVWTGGEPLLQIEYIVEVIDKLNVKYFHALETNGDLICEQLMKDYIEKFNYVSVSPKDFDTAMKIDKLFNEIDIFIDYDIKVVCDGDILGLNYSFLSLSTMLMPLTTFDEEKDIKIKKNVWELCRIMNKKYCPRLHIDLFGKRRGV